MKIMPTSLPLMMKIMPLTMKILPTTSLSATRIPLMMKISLMINFKAMRMLPTMKILLTMTFRSMTMIKITSLTIINLPMTNLNQMAIARVKMTGKTKIGMKVHLIFTISQSWLTVLLTCTTIKKNLRKFQSLNSAICFMKLVIIMMAWI